MDTRPAPAPRIADVLAIAGPAYDDLTALGEEVEDEWSYVNDLVDAWRARLDEVDRVRGDEPVRPGVMRAVTALAEEAAAIEDPHRAIDWLSTFPQVLLIALGERP